MMKRFQINKERVVSVLCNYPNEDCPVIKYVQNQNMELKIAENQIDVFEAKNPEVCENIVRYLCSHGGCATMLKSKTTNNNGK
ncbi:MAG: hypothetical protein K5912_01795 [Alphaproteobacteria bacterium]|nr:hypothetical protein [Alphaproteobacteria bacterium]